MSVVLPTFVDTPLYEYRVTIARREYVVRIDYNGREDRWYLELFDANRVSISGRRKVVCFKPLLRHCHHNPACPPGEIFALDPKGSAASPGPAPSWLDLGRRVTLRFIELGVPS